MNNIENLKREIRTSSRAAVKLNRKKGRATKKDEQRMAFLNAYIYACKLTLLRESGQGA